MLIACIRNPFTLVSTSLNTHIRKQMRIPKGRGRVKKELCCSPTNTISKGDCDLQGKPPGRPLLFKEKIKYHINHSLGREQQTCGCKRVWDGHLMQWSLPTPGRAAPLVTAGLGRSSDEVIVRSRAGSALGTARLGWSCGRGGHRPLQGRVAPLSTALGSPRAACRLPRGQRAASRPEGAELQAGALPDRLVPTWVGQGCPRGCAPPTPAQLRPRESPHLLASGHQRRTWASVWGKPNRGHRSGLDGCKDE